MDFSFTAEEESFREEVAQWLQSALPSGWGRSVFEPEDEDQSAAFRIEWDRKLYEGGWAGISWPKTYGGRGATLVEKAIFYMELAKARAPEGMNIIGRNLTGPTLIHHGTEDQRRRFLPKILTGEEVWCQGFSEPGAGSDLASLKTTAVKDGDHFIVNGQKLWTSFAQYAHWCIALVRTDSTAPKHKGISFLLIDMKTPGVSVRPVKQISGRSQFCETFFDNVKVPAENLVGQMNVGWQIAMTTLAHERGPEDALVRQIRFQQDLERLIELASTTRRGGRAVIDDPVVRQKLASSLVEIELMRLNCLRSFSRMTQGKNLGPESSFQKLYWSHAGQNLYETGMAVLGPLAPITAGDPLSADGGIFQRNYLQSRAFTIYSGTSEIQRNIIGERVLGLPR